MKRIQARFAGVALLLKVRPVTEGHVSRNRREMRKADADFSVHDFHWIGFQIHFRRALSDLARADVETGAVPRTLDPGAAQGAFRKRSITMRAEFLKGVEVTIDFCDYDDRTIYISA